MKKILLIILGFAAVGMQQAQATVYYINDNTLETGSICSAVGNDANDGLTPATPKTLNFVNVGNAIHPGDIVYIDKGLYSNIWNCGGGINAGTSDNHIQFIGVDSSSTIIQGTAGVGGTNAISLACFGNDTDLYWDFSNIGLDGVSGMPALYVGTGGRNFRYATFTDCLIRSQGTSAITLNASMANFTFTGCKIQSDQVCINLAGGSNNIHNSFINCRIVHTAANAQTMIAIGNGLRHDNTFDQCTITNAGNGFLFDFPGGNYNNTQITNSQLQGNNSSEAVHISNGTALIGFQFTNNYVSNVQTGIASGNPGQGGLNIQHNSFYTSGNCIGNAATGGFLVDATIRNNIFHTTGAAANSVIYISNTSAPAASDYNLYYMPSGANAGAYNGITQASLATWQNVFNSNDVNSATGDPLYTSAATGDLSIGCSSPAYQTGGTTSLTTDIFGNTRPATPSKGAFENTNSVSIAATAATPSFCEGGSTTITASGATSYSWTPSTGLDMTTGEEVTANPASTITYTVTGTSAGCSGSTTVTITVNEAPTISVSPSAPAICEGSEATLTASGAATYSWTPATDLSATTGNIVTATPVSDITYTVTGTDIHNCTGSATVSVTVNALPAAPVLSAFADVCSNDAAVVLSSGTPAGGAYSGTGVTSGSFHPSVAGAGTHTITYTITDANLCSASASQDITVTVCTSINGAAGKIITGVFPNPNEGSFLLNFDPKKGGDVTILLLDAQGKEQYRSAKSIPSGQSYESLKLDLTPGIYHLQVVYEGNTYHEKVVIR